MGWQIYRKVEQLGTRNYRFIKKASFFWLSFIFLTKNQEQYLLFLKNSVRKVHKRENLKKRRSFLEFERWQKRY